MHSENLGTTAGAAGDSHLPVVVGSYEIGVGEDDGMSIRDSNAPTLAGGRNEKALINAFKRDNEPKSRRGPVDDLQDAADRADDATTQVERAETLAIEVVQNSLTVGAINNELDSMLALLQRLDTKNRFDKELRVARALSKLLAVAERWLDLVRALEQVLAAARASKDRAAEAWASHELGTLRLAAGQLRAADALLTEALSIREALGDRRGAAATSRNLSVLCRALRFKLQRRQLLEARRLLRMFPALPLVLVLTVVLCGTAAVALGIVVRPTPAPVVSSISPTSGRSSGGTRVTIRGEHLKRNSVVLFGQQRATVIGTVGDPSLIVIAPAGHGTVPVRVRTDGRLSALSRAPLFKYTSAVQSPPGHIRISGFANPRADGSVGVSSSSPGASCSGSSCTLDSGGDVTLAATPNRGERFSGWSGACAGETSSTCTLNDLKANASATAAFSGSSQQVSLVTVTGSADPSADGGVSANSSSPGASCAGSSCTLDSGGDVTLIATPKTGSRFSRWSGSCAGQTGSACTLDDVTADESATAAFSGRGKQGRLVTVTGSADPSADGSVSANSSSWGASCSGASCTIDSDGDVTLTAMPSTGYDFGGWSGACAGQTGATCTLNAISSDESATATFVARITVTGSADPTADGSIGVTSSSQGESCSGSSCTLDSRGAVTLTATPITGYDFSSWSGACAGQTGSTCTLTDVSSDESATAAFVARFTVTGSANPSADGSVSADSSSQGESCSGSSCTLDSGGDVTLTATPNSGFRFKGWSGACAKQTDLTCTLNGVSSDEIATATFEVSES